MFSRFGTIPACDRRMDGRTQDDSIYRASIASRGKNVSYIEGCRRCRAGRQRVKVDEHAAAVGSTGNGNGGGL